MTEVMRLGKTLGPFSFAAAVALLLVALLFGGATRLDVLAPVVPRILAVGVIAALLWRGQKLFAGWTLLEKAIWSMLLFVPLIQLIPLPFELWTQLPGHEYPARLFGLLGMQPVEPISMTPDRTINGFYALLPAFAAYILGRKADPREIRTLFNIIFYFAIASAILGLMQVADGDGSALRFYRITNSDSSVGFFSNANHHASFLSATILFLAYWTVARADQRRAMTRGTLLIALCALGILIGSIFLTFSRAGIVFAALAVGAVFVMMMNQFGLKRRTGLIAIAITAAVGTGIYLYFISQPGIGERMTVNIYNEGRIGIIPTFVRMIGDFMPFGSGVGSFDPVYRGYEVAQNLQFNYLNNAHNDYAQLLIEVGVFAAIGLILFTAWWLRAFWTIWSGRTDSGHFALQTRIACFVTLILLAHSLADYPLRGAGVSVVFALCCAIMSRYRADIENADAV